VRTVMVRGRLNGVGPRRSGNIDQPMRRVGNISHVMGVGFGIS